jgi:predicted RNA-binding protein Jag
MSMVKEYLEEVSDEMGCLGEIDGNVINEAQRRLVCFNEKWKELIEMLMKMDMKTLEALTILLKDMGDKI